jgi:hypothetical protein
VNIVEILCIHVWKWKIIPVETIPGMGGMVEGINSSMIYLIHCRNFCKCNNVPPPCTTIKKEIHFEPTI